VSADDAPTPRPRRLLVIIGAMKCGTTSVFTHLSGHPEVLRSVHKEPGFFLRVPGFPKFGLVSDDDYFGLWRGWDPTRHRLALEASTHYTKPHLGDAVGHAAAFAARHDVDMRFVYCVRHPLARMESQLGHIARRQPQRVLSERAAVVAEATAMSCYASRVAPWIEAFGRERVTIVPLDRLEREPDATLAGLCRFAGIDPSFRFARAAEPFNTSEGRRRRPLVSLWSMRRVVGRVWQRLPGGARRRLLDALRPLLDRQGYMLTAAEAHAAIPRLVPEMARLAREHGVDTSGWRLVWPPARRGGRQAS